MEIIIILLLPLAAISGWRMAMNSEARALRKNKARSSYFEGLNYLLNDKSERAVEVFTNLPDIDQQTVDNQLILGTLFRKRGELDRALHLHNQLYHDTRLEKSQKFAVTYELAEDFVQAGMYVQAQSLFEDLLNNNYREQEVKSALAKIYERLFLWQKAIDLNYAEAEKIAHYYCSLAETDKEKAEYYLQQALLVDAHCGRAYWKKAELYAENGEWINVITQLQTFSMWSPKLLIEIIPLLTTAYKNLGREKEGLKILLQAEEEQNNPRLTLAILPLLNKEDAQNLLQKRLESSNNPLFLAQHLDYFEYKYPEKLRKNISPETIYQCQNCGFRHKLLIWQCPACFAWNTFQALLELKIIQK